MLVRSIIDVILETTTREIEARKVSVPVEKLKRMAKDASPSRSLKAALSATPFSIIAEVKAMSPSGGAMDAKNVERAAYEYERAPGVSAISVLTETRHFGGSLERLAEIRKATTKPVLRKDFIVDEYQVWEAKAYGADAILLMASLKPLSANKGRLLHRLYDLATDLGMDCLCEMGMTSHNEHASSVRGGIPAKAQIWGVNSRKFTSSSIRFRARVADLVHRWRGFSDPWADLSEHARLRKEIPASRIAVAESGISGPEQLRHLLDLDYRAALIGTAFLKGPASVADTVKAFSDEVCRLRSAAPVREASRGARPLRVRHA